MLCRKIYVLYRKFQIVCRKSGILHRFFKITVMRIHTCFSNLAHDLRGLCGRRAHVVLRADVKFSGGRVRPHNWGDDLNCFLAEAISGGRATVKNKSFLDLLPVKNYVCIGSTLEYMPDRHTIVWGAGAQYGERPLRVRPQQVLAVRGRLTRRFLLNQGIDCPEVYGDPALLLPRFHRPEVRADYRVGFIPHKADRDNVFVKEYVGKHDDALFIDFTRYGDWREVADKICRCGMILSSSLHGLIAADAYGIPNAWIRLSDRVEGGEFKFKDYFSAVGRRSDVLNIDCAIGTNLPETAVRAWRPIDFDDRPLWQACPFRKD